MEAFAAFRYPWLLAVLVLPLALLARIWVRRARLGPAWLGRGGAIVLPLDHAISGAGRWLGHALRVAESLAPLLLALAIILLAQPQRWDEPHTQRALTNIEFCVDVSGSMMSKFGEGTRYDASMKAINEFLDFRTGDAFGLTFFGNAVLHWVPLTTDVSAFRCAPPFMRPGQLPPWFGGTEIAKALEACKKVLVAREQGDRMIILVTDGYSADLGGGRDAELAAELHAANIVVYAVNVSGSEVPGPIVTLTAGTGGEVFAPGEPDGLSQVFQRIDQMQVTKLEKIQSETVDDYALLCELGLGAAALALLFSLGLRSTPW